ncbi:hypothetical protein Glo7428_4586 [Gloeocapsa sp. PCC 7428]|uniref:hypothetical protein n=1 Tax=Gloeocapsa sp. PCC 7428 TaxID=1173026 RepID=UPI0002A5DA90|nr:hypothetical protein [Gloeocapsa sp. PCC 7428]AFZ33022.1 hypothetical protein Glo7428_4586 [Gloeocapsa sp. PCC 7428]
MNDSIFVIFIVFGCIWIVLGAAGWIALLKSEGEEIRLGKWGLIVALPIVIPIIVALVLGVAYAN